MYDLYETARFRTRLGLGEQGDDVVTVEGAAVCARARLHPHPEASLRLVQEWLVLVGRLRAACPAGSS